MTEFKHLPVLADEVMRLMELDSPRLYVDLTAGGGGHAELFLNRYPDLTLVLLDRDPDAIRHLKKKFEGVERVKIAHARAAEIDKVLFLMKEDRPDLILADLGVSSHQFDTSERGSLLLTVRWI